MATPVTLALQATGISEVKNALKSVKQAYVEMEKDATAATEAATRKRIQLIKEETKAKKDSIRELSNAKKEASASESKFKKSLGGGSGGGDALKGSGVSDLLKNAGMAGAAFALVSSAVNMATGALKQFGSFVINDVVKPAWALQTRAQQVANNSQGMLTTAGIQDKAKAIGLANNMDPMKVIESAGAFQDLTGDAKQGFELMPMFAAMSKGRGDADPKELAELAASFRTDGMSTKTLQDIMLAYAGQGEKGSITIGQLAKLGGRISAPAERMGGDQFTKMTTAGALLQTSRHGFGTVDDAAAGLKGFMDDAFKVGKGISAKSFARVNGADTLLDPTKFIGDIFRKTGGNNLAGRGFSAPAAKFLESYQGTYKEAYASAKGEGKTDTQAKEAGATAVEEFINAMKKSTSTMEAEGQKRDAVMGTAGERFTQAFDKIKDKLTASALPMAEKFVSFLEKNGEALERAGGTILGAIGYLTDAFLFLMDGVIGWAEFFDQLVTNHTTGDVRKTMTQDQLDRKGDFPEVRTSGPLGGDAIRGAWVREESGVKGQKDSYKYMQIDEGTDIEQFMADRGMAPASGWGPKDRKNGQGLFVKKKATPTAAYSYEAPEATSTAFDPYTSSAANPAQPEEAGDTTTSDPGSAAAAESSQKLATNAGDAAEAIKKLTTQVDSLATSVDGLNRSQSFTQQASGGS